jgi:serine/threonine-protein kinase
MSDEQFGPYQLQALLGRGGMGEVYRAFDTEHERLVALKRLAPHLAEDPGFRTRFKQEARLAARLRNPHIITIHRFGELDGHLFIDMRYVDGFDAADLVRAVGPLLPQRAVALVEQVGSALDTAHAAGLVHRDVKPSNLLIDSETSQPLGDFVYLADFGITRASSTMRSHSLTRTGALLGSLDYMAPEQFDGIVDKGVDVYALTCVLFELLTGQRPYQGAGLPALMHAHLNLAPPIPSESRPDLGTAFDDVVQRGMAKVSDQRFDSAGELAGAARASLANCPTVLAGDGPAVPDRRGSQRFREAEYAYVTQRKAQERIRLSGRHQLVEDSGATELPPVARPSVPAQQVEEPRTEDALTDAAATDEVAERPADPEAEVATDLPLTGTTPTDLQTEADINLSPVAPAPTHPGPAPDADEVSSAPGTEKSPIVRVGDVRLGQADRRWGSQVVATALAVVGVLVVVLGFAAFGPTWGAAGRGGDAAISAPAPLPPSETATEEASSPAPPSTASPIVQAIVPVGAGPQGLAVTPDSGTVLVASLTAQTVSVIDRLSGASTTAIPMPGTPRYLTVSPDGTRAYVSMYGDDGADSAIAVLDLTARSVTAVLPSGPQPYALAAAGNGDVYVPNHGAANVSILDADRQQFTVAVPVSPNPHGIAFDPAGYQAYTADHESNNVSVIDLRSNTVTARIPVGLSPHSVAVSPDGRMVAAANYGDATVTLIDTATKRVSGTLPAGPTPQHVTFARDGRHLYVVNEEANQISTLDVAAGATVTTTPVGASPRFVVAAGDGRYLYVSNGGDGTVSVLNAT